MTKWMAIKRRTSAKGFTLAEVLIVVAVVGVLVGIGMLTYNNIIETA